MRKGGSKAKGSGFERQIAKDIVKAFKKFGVTQRDCWRSVLSGGHEMSSGDLEMTPKMEGLFAYSVECKFHKKIDWWHYLVPAWARRGSWKELQWVSQTLQGAKKRPQLRPLLVLKENRGPIFAMQLSQTADEDFELYLVTWNEFLKDAVLRATQREKEKQ